MALIQWIDICDAAGLATRNLDPVTCHLLAGKILSDAVVFERKKQFAVGNVMPAGSAIKVLRAMTNAERAELRERIQIA